jgi:hypothetical protein
MRRRVVTTILLQAGSVMTLLGLGLLSLTIRLLLDFGVLHTLHRS